MTTQVRDDPMYAPMEMVRDRLEAERAEIIQRIDDAYARLEAQRRIEEEPAWAEHERNGG